jgi:predicted CXXCH cytochrome family protein
MSCCCGWGGKSWAESIRPAKANRGMAAALALALLAGSFPGLGQAAVSKGQAHAVGHTECATCHAGHKAAGPRLLRQRSTGELCASCHQRPEPSSRTTPVTDAPAQLPQFTGAGSSHLDTLQLERGERPYVRVVQGGGRRVVLRSDCDGCHDPHVKERGKLRQVIFDSRGELTVARPVYVAQICFGCHAGRDAARLRGVPEGQHDIGSRFGQGAASSHAIGHSAKDRPDLPSLNGTRFQGRLDCTSCHDGPEGSETRGPHVSPFPYLLKAPYGTERNGFAGMGSDDLCFTCHSRSAIEANQSFSYHRQHIEGFISGLSAGKPALSPARPGESFSFGGEPQLNPKKPKPGNRGVFMPGFGEPTPCATCHDPHGSRQNPALIRFDTAVVSPSSVGGPDYRRTGFGHGICTLSCHGYDHVQVTY